jgi:seryl-tRNA synthetase
MLDIKWIRDNPQVLVDALVKRQWSEDEAQSAVEDLVERDEARRAHLGELQQKQERRNAASKEIGNSMRAGDMARADELKLEVNGIKTWLSNAEARERELDAELDAALAVLPNIPLDDVPVGADEHANVEVRRVGEVRPRPNWAKEHFEIGEKLGMMDFARAAKLSGSRFTVLKGQLARLERALGQFMLDLHTTEHGYTEVQPPLLVRGETMYGTGQLPKFEDDLFKSSTRMHERLLSIIGQTARIETLIDDEKKSVKKYEAEIDGYVPPANPTILGGIHPAEMVRYCEERISKFEDVRRQLVEERDALIERGGSAIAQRYLIPTAEVPLTNLVREEIVKHDDLPLRFTALTPCFRSEAGSAGRDTRGMLRQHQFYKVELVSITDQENSLGEHERMTECAEEVLKRLGLPFRTVALCTGDMGFGARKTYDIEVWLPGQNAFREISSCSVCGDFQARRMMARYRDREGRGNLFVHTLNGSGVAVGRALIAVMENYQEADGSVAVPEVLQPYMGGLKRIGAA